MAPELFDCGMKRVILMCLFVSIDSQGFGDHLIFFRNAFNFNDDKLNNIQAQRHGIICHIKVSYDHEPIAVRTKDPSPKSRRF